MSKGRSLVAALTFVALVGAAIGSLGAPLITAVAQEYGVSLSASQWTLTIALLSGAVSAPLVGRLGSTRRRAVIIAVLVIVVAGSLATVLPAPFWVLLAGRAAQGLGLGLTAVMMAVARDHLGDRAPGTIAMLSVASTVGVGVGYPVVGLLTQFGGVRVAYLLGLVTSVAALVAVVLVVPADRPAPARNGPVDWLGAFLLSLGLIGVLLATSRADLWTHPVVAGGILAAGLVVLAGWVLAERRVRRPLVDLTALRRPAVARANLIMLVAGVAMYLLFALVTRYVQTPPEAGYGYGLTEFQAGLVLVPFSILGFVSGRLVPRLRDRVSPFALLAASGVVVGVAGGLFAATRSLGVVWPIVAMTVLGFAVGGFSATMPQAILAATPPEDTAAAMSVNQVVRAVGFSMGSALAGLVLAAHTPGRAFAPLGTGYTTAAWTAGALAAASIALAVLPQSASQRSSTQPSS